MEIKEGYESLEKRINRVAIDDLEHQIESLSEKISQLTERKEKLELSLNVYQLIEQKDVKKIKKLLLSKYHKKVLRILFMYYDQEESKIAFLYDQFDHTIQFNPSLVENEDEIFKTFISRLRKPIKHKTMTHIPVSGWYAKRKSLREQGES